MKFAIVILFFLAATAQGDDDDDDTTFQLIYEMASGIMRGFQAPMKLAKGVNTREFIQYTAESASELLGKFVLDYHRQATHEKKTIIKDMKSAKKKLIAEDTDNSTMQNSLEIVNNILTKLMSAMPGNIEIEHETLPDLPEPRGEIVTHWENEEFSQIFLDLPSLMDRDLASIHSLIDNTYLAGWHRARMMLNEVQYQFRTDYLNSMIKAVRKELAAINKNAENITMIVDGETWENYGNLNATIYEAYFSIRNE